MCNVNNYRLYIICVGHLASLSKKCRVKFYIDLYISGQEQQRSYKIVIIFHIFLTPLLGSRPTHLEQR